MKYGKLISGDLVLSKKYLIYNGRKIWNAPESLWLEAGWKHVVYGEFPEGYEEYITEYSEDETYILVTYRGVESE